MSKLAYLYLNTISGVVLETEICKKIIGTRGGKFSIQTKHVFIWIQRTAYKWVVFSRGNYKRFHFFLFQKHYNRQKSFFSILLSLCLRLPFATLNSFNSKALAIQLFCPVSISKRDGLISHKSLPSICKLICQECLLDSSTQKNFSTFYNIHILHKIHNPLNQTSYKD